MTVLLVQDGAKTRKVGYFHPINSFKVYWKRKPEVMDKLLPYGLQFASAKILVEERRGKSSTVSQDDETVVANQMQYLQKHAWELRAQMPHKVFEANFAAITIETYGNVATVLGIAGVISGILLEETVTALVGIGLFIYGFSISLRGVSNLFPWNQHWQNVEDVAGASPQNVRFVVAKNPSPEIPEMPGK